MPSGPPREPLLSYPPALGVFFEMFADIAVMHFAVTGMRARFRSIRSGGACATKTANSRSSPSADAGQRYRHADLDLSSLFGCSVGGMKATIIHGIEVSNGGGVTSRCS